MTWPPMTSPRRTCSSSAHSSPPWGAPTWKPHPSSRRSLIGTSCWTISTRSPCRGTEVSPCWRGTGFRRIYFQKIKQQRQRKRQQQQGNLRGTCCCFFAVFVVFAVVDSFINFMVKLKLSFVPLVTIWSCSCLKTSYFYFNIRLKGGSVGEPRTFSFKV